MIQISLAVTKSAKDDIPAMFVLPETIPKPVLAKYNAGWTVMVGHRPLLGDIDATGENVYGRHWVAVNNRSDNHEKVLEENAKLNARIIEPISKEALTLAALARNKYKAQYMEMELNERHSLLESKIRKLEGLPHVELMRILRENT